MRIAKLDYLEEAIKVTGISKSRYRLDVSDRLLKETTVIIYR